MSDLTLAQKRMLADLNFEVDVYVFQKGENDYTFSYYKDNTWSRVYTTATTKSLIRKNLCKIKFCDIEGSLDNCVGVLERVI